MPLPLRIPVVLALAGVGLFGIYGFLASFEPNANAMTWRIGFGVLAVGALLAAAGIALGKRLR